MLYFVENYKSALLV